MYLIRYVYVDADEWIRFRDTGVWGECGVTCVGGGWWVVTWQNLVGYGCLWLAATGRLGQLPLWQVRTPSLKTP